MQPIEPAYLFLIGNLKLADFEHWLYYTPKVSALFGPALYLELVSINFSSKSAPHEARVLLEKHAAGPAFELWRLEHQLTSAIRSNPAAALKALASIYDEYCAGYYFLDSIALVYGLSAIDQLNGGKGRPSQSVDAQLLAEVSLVLDWLSNGQIKLEGYSDRDDRKLFLDSRPLADRSPRLYKTS